MARLRIRHASGEDEVVELSGERVSIGRAPDNEVQLQDRTVSRYHAVIARQCDGWHLTDLGSHNLTRVNGAPALSHRLATGDQIQVGNLALEFYEDAPWAAAPKRSPRAEAGGSITETIRVDRVGFGAFGEQPEADSARRQQRLRRLLELAQIAISVRTVPPLLDGVIQMLRDTLDADRVLPLLESGGALRAYLGAGREPTADVGPLGLNMELVGQCRREAVGAVWAGGGGGPGVACAPVRVGQQAHGLLYCERADGAEEFSRQDLCYLLAVAILTGLALENLRSYSRMARRAGSLSRQIEQSYNMVGESEAMKRVYALIRRAAPTDAGVLICGESGTGKEMIARALHRYSRRSQGPLEIVNCAAIPPTLLESELFGHVRGAFTGAIADRPGRFELADGGTLFLDEVLELTVECQTKLLRALEEGKVRRVGDTRDRPVDVRVLAATNRDPAAARERGELRRDLFYRLDRLRICAPPLRERDGDVELLSRHFLDQCNAAMDRSFTGFAPEVMGAFRRYKWPGNVRELRNVVERMALVGEGRSLALADVPDFLIEADAPRRGAARALREVEKEHIVRALREAGGNKSQAARTLGIDRSTLYAKLKRYGIDA